MNKVMLCKILWKGARRKWVLCRLVGCNTEIRNMAHGYEAQEGYTMPKEGRV